MKKKFLSGIFALALLATAGYGVNKSMKSDDGLSDLALANVEALANGEDSCPKFSCVEKEEMSWGISLKCYGCGSLECKL